MGTTTPTKVIIYCRVSSKKQVTDGNGLDSQEQVCRAWAKQRGLVIERVFREEGVSGGKEDRPALDAMLEFLFASKEQYIVLFYDVSRVARDTEIFWNIYNRIVAKGHKLDTTQNKIEDTPVGKFITTITAAQSQLFREENAIKTKNNMKVHAKQGYWIFRAPTGYLPTRVGKYIHLTRNEPTATYLQHALEGFANNRFLTQKDVYNFLCDKTIVGFNNKPIHVTLNFVKNLLTNEKYTGCFAYPEWNIPYQQWHIEPIITTECFNAIQDRIKGRKSNKKTRKYNKSDEDFPLRRWVKCAACGHLMTADKPRSKSGKHHLYYHCYNKDCPMGNKNIQQKVMHEDFEQLLQKITPAKDLLNLTAEITKRAYNDKYHYVQQQRKDIAQQIEKKKQEKENTFNLLVAGNISDETKSICDKHICALESEIKLLEHQLTEPQDEPLPLDSALDTVLAFVQKPVQIWQTGDYAQRQGVLNLCFSDKISYDKVEKFRTPALSPVFRLFNENTGILEEWRAQKDSNPQPSDP